MPGNTDDQDNIYDYLEGASRRSRGTDPVPFTRAEIARQTRLDESEVKAALGKMEDVHAHWVHVKVYLADTAAGDKIYRRLARVGMLAPSIYAAIVLVLLSLWLIVDNYPPSKLAAQSPQEADAYLDGARAAIGYALIPGLPAVAVVHFVWTRLLHWRARKEEVYDRVRQVTTASTVAGLAFVGAYLGLAYLKQWESSPAIAAGLFLGGFPIGWSYWHLVSSAGRSKSAD